MNETNYPFIIKVIQENDGCFLVEEDSLTRKEKAEKYGLINNVIKHLNTRISLEIYSLGCTTHILQNCFEEKLIGKARFQDSWNDSISFFGTDRKIENFDIIISLTNNKEGFIFKAHEVYEDEDEYREESVCIEFHINGLKFRKIKYLVEKNCVNNIYCSFAVSDAKGTIAGLYMRDSMAPWFEYKILKYKKQIINPEILPESFNDLGGWLGQFYQKEFSILIDEKSQFISSKKLKELKAMEEVEGLQSLPLGPAEQKLYYIKQLYNYSVKQHTIIKYCLLALILIAIQLAKWI